MEKPVIISIKSTQNMDGQEDTIELVTQGVLRHSEEEGFALVYPESELTGLEGGTLTTFRIAPDRITLLREGTINSEMIFEEGQKHFSLYETPFGGLMLGVNTHRAKAAKAISPDIYLMKNVTAPAVLVECGFLSNPEETIALGDPVYQRKLSAAIVSGYLKTYEEPT